ncbi:hypothetical protein L596_000616 [Steinernema carpocapsae]|uniref:Uncharacterized protein n=1 Tax=Steinernema carpocapsae TaxID=34508 RepID=A0A4U8UL11_STECR|nr:hypothetical protein L596_000616 [Steinernema carpocapsae]
MDHLPTGSKKEIQNAENEAVQAYFEKTLKCIEGRYEVAFPFKEGLRVHVPSNYAMAFKRMMSPTTRSRGTQSSGQDRQHIEDQLANGIIEEVPTDELYKEADVHYLPHQPVITPQKDTTKVRVVFDASAHIRGALSLNEAIHQGPAILPKITAICCASGPETSPASATSRRRSCRSASHRLTGT